MKKREANFELLRIVAMLMIVTLHYLDKGGILPKPDSAFGLSGFLAWGLEAFCVSAVNVYVLLSAYFLAEGEYRPMRVAKLWTQVFFYSVGIAAVLMITGIVPVATVDKYRLLGYVFPIITEHYWFVTAYMLMFLFAPLMNEGLRKLSEKGYRQGIFLLLLVLSVSKSVLPMKLPTDRLGYDALWFLCLYLIGAYIRYHAGGDAVLKKADSLKAALAGYVFCSLLIFAGFVAVRGLFLKTGSLGEFINRQYHYNSIFCLLASVFLFFIFRNIKLPKGKVSEWVCKAASASLGVYLIHEHLDMRYLWPVWMRVSDFADTPLFLLYWIPGVVTVYVVCMLIDFARQFVFDKIGSYFSDGAKKDYYDNK